MPTVAWAPATLIDTVLLVTVVEAFVLWIYHRKTGKGIPPRDFLGNLMSGLMLMAALRAHISNQPWFTMAGLLAASGVAHAADLWMRWRR